MIVFRYTITIILEGLDNDLKYPPPPGRWVKPSSFLERMW